MGLRHFLSTLADFCYPSKCVRCENGFEGKGPLCQACDAELVGLQNAPWCRRCGAPVGHEAGPCGHCQNDGVAHYDSISRLGVYREPLRELVHQLKYNNRWSLADELAGRLHQIESVRQALADADLIVPVPLHWRRQLQRGYNQSELLARALRKRTKLKLARPLVRIRDTPTQTRLSREQRENNLRGAFALVDADGVRGKRVVVIDDVMTSGATLRTVGHALSAARPAALHAVVIAVADPKGRDFETV